MSLCVRCVIVATALLLAACAGDPNMRVPMTPTAKADAPIDKGVVVMGISARNTHRDGILGVGIPIWIGWMQFDPATGRRVGKQMIVAGEDCNGMGALAGAFTTDVFVRNSDACKTVQYRAYTLEPGNYTLAWSYHAYALYGFARFREGEVNYHPNGMLARYEFSDDALVRPGNVSFSIAPGEVVYVGDITVDFQTINAKVTSDPGDAEAAHKYVEAMGMADKLISRPMAHVTTTAIGEIRKTK